MAELMAAPMPVFMDTPGTKFMIKKVIGFLGMTTFD